METPYDIICTACVMLRARSDEDESLLKTLFLDYDGDKNIV